MSALLKPQAAALPANQLARVIADRGDDVFFVETEGRGYNCRRAASCLLLPEAGDRVLIAAVDSTLEIYLLAVIERASAGPARLQVKGDLLLASGQGSIRMQAAQSLDISSESLALRARSGDLAVERLNCSGVLWQGTLGTVRLIGQVCETMVDRLMQLAKVSFRRVEQLEHVRAAQLDYEGSVRVRLRGRHTAITARDVLKAKGRQVHIG
ncbi:DUF3540 domain-containing protein [Azotobacter chroococcum]|uniref:DUF3540 domain-containing protein n=1 Tax=Azotobacter chroococcum TaxID=353 RepID=UPI0010AE549C|nr:DUF3540 domain-containing protein [Azotobacter chroococcum]TKD35160.1 DUF3540 domain-containing protein [Azotobacter chroococcum]